LPLQDSHATSHSAKQSIFTEYQDNLTNFRFTFRIFGNLFNSIGKHHLTWDAKILSNTADKADDLHGEQFKAAVNLTPPFRFELTIESQHKDLIFGSLPFVRNDIVMAGRSGDVAPLESHIDCGERCIFSS